MSQKKPLPLLSLDSASTLAIMDSVYFLLFYALPSKLKSSMDASLLEGSHKTSCMGGWESKYLASLIGGGSGFQDSSEGNSLGICRCSYAEQPKSDLSFMMLFSGILSCSPSSLNSCSYSDVFSSKRPFLRLCLKWQFPISDPVFSLFLTCLTFSS